MTTGYEKLKGIIESVNAITWEYNIVKDVWEYVSPQSKNILGYTPNEWINLEFWVNNIYREDRNWAVDYCLKCTEEGKDHIFEYRFIKKNGDIIWLRDEVVIVKKNNEPVKLRGFMTDITELKEREDKIKYLLYKDQLTGIYNRRFFEEEMQRLDSERMFPLSIIMADVNGLKIINDTYGHEKGDELLKTVAMILKNSLREEDILARQGGDEFAVLLPNTDKVQARNIMSRIKDSVMKNNNNEFSISIALGIAIKESSEENISTVLKEADNNMYQNKLAESRSSRSNIVQGLLNTLNAKSSETKEHAERMTKLAYDFGEVLDLSNSEVNRLSLLATLHDIGKSTISAEILKKPEKLNEKEWELIKEHPITGYKIASASKEFALIANDILYHHERWDGKGYPDGLIKDEIPYLARIIAIIDSYDVMTNERPYSKAITKTEALIEIKSCSGTQFDPNLAQKFVDLIDLYDN